MKKIIVTSSFERAFDDLSKEIQDTVLKKIDLLAQENEFLDVKKMEPKQIWLWRLRVGKYRIVFEYMGSEEIKLIKVDSRDNIYK